MSTARTHIRRVGPSLGVHRPRVSERPVDAAPMVAVVVTDEEYTIVEDYTIEVEVEAEPVAVEAEAASEFDPADHNVEAVKEFVTANPDQAEAIYISESEGKSRSGLLTWLEAFTEADPA